MYSKVYWIGCDDGNADALIAWYDESVVPFVEGSDNHVGHHMISCGDNKWLLVSNYHNKDAAAAAASSVQEIVSPMVEKLGMTLEVITEGDVTHSY